MKIFNLKNVCRALAMVLIIATALTSLISCKKEEGSENEHIDYAASVKLDMNSSSVKKEVTVKSYIDGDTTHFYIEDAAIPSGVLKARYLAVNTPESTGKIEEWGKTAAKFTKDKLMGATSIYVESDDDKWNLDSTGDRHLVWVWYKGEGDSDYRNLNIEILQNGLAKASSSANNKYGETCMAAIGQAKAETLHVYSTEKDPLFPYGQATELTLKELRTNIESYDGMKVAFEGVVTKIYSNTAYVEDYDEETGLYYGMTVYYGFSLSGTGLEMMAVGNRLRIVGSVQFYENGGTYQVSGLQYSEMRPNHADNIQLISTGNKGSFKLTDADTFKNGSLDIVVGDEKKTFSYAALAMSTSVEMQNLVVKRLYTTNNEESSSNGAITITCEVNGVTLDVRTVVLKDENGATVTEDYFEGKTIDVLGIVDYYEGSYQIKVYSFSDIHIH
jgi:endonuclease YncB( thermonuclease family)